MLCVRPGVLLVLASPLIPVSALSSELLPTLERPASATSMRFHRGHSLAAKAEVTNCASSFMIDGGSILAENQSTKLRATPRLKCSRRSFSMRHRKLVLLAAPIAWLAYEG